MATGQGQLTIATINVTPGQTYTIKVGAGGAGGYNGYYGTNGGDSSAFGVTGAGGYSGSTYSGGGACGSSSTYSGTAGGTGQSGWVNVTYSLQKRKVLSDDYRLVRYQGNTYNIAATDAAQYMPLIKEMD